MKKLKKTSLDLTKVLITDDNGVVLLARLNECLHAWNCISTILPDSITMTVDQVLGYEKVLMPQERVRPLKFNGIKIRIK